MMTLIKVFFESQIKSIDLGALTSKLQQIVSCLLSTQTPDSIEEKMIIDNAMSVWATCINQQPDLFESFQAQKDFGTDKIENAYNFMLSGLLFCPVEKVRMSFKSALQQLTQTEYIMKFLSANFGLITEYSCREYFDLFGQTVEAFFEKAGAANIANLFDPEVLLG